MNQRKIKKYTNDKKYKRNYTKKKEDPIKLYEIDVILSKDGKSYKAYAPACTTVGVMNALNNIVDYIRKYNQIQFDVYVDPVV